MSLWQRLATILDIPLFYSLWQAPFVGPKMAAIRRHNQPLSPRRVLDVGCGPGVNVPYFPGASYTGIDLNPRYVTQAKRRHNGEFIVADATRMENLAGAAYDFVLLNSLLHHLSTEDAHRALHGASAKLESSGHVHILDLVLPRNRGLPRWLARHDRGAYARPPEEWRAMFREHFAEVVFEPFVIRRLGLNLLEMVYFKGRAIEDSASDRS